MTLLVIILCRQEPSLVYPAVLRFAWPDNTWMAVEVHQQAPAWLVRWGASAVQQVRVEYTA